MKSLAQKIESQKITNLLCLSVTLVGDDAVVFGINRYVFLCNINSQSYFQLVKLFVIVRNSYVFLVKVIIFYVIYKCNSYVSIQHYTMKEMLDFNTAMRDKFLGVILYVCKEVRLAMK